MAPGDAQGFGVDAAELARMTIPACITVGEGDKVTPPEDTAEACMDAAGVDRAALHRYVGDAARRFLDAHFGG